MVLIIVMFKVLTLLKCLIVDTLAMLNYVTDFRCGEMFVYPKATVILFTLYNVYAWFIYYLL